MEALYLKMAAIEKLTRAQQHTTRANNKRHWEHSNIILEFFQLLRSLMLADASQAEIYVVLDAFDDYIVDADASKERQTPFKALKAILRIELKQFDDHKMCIEHLDEVHTQAMAPRMRGERERNRGPRGENRGGSNRFQPYPQPAPQYLPHHQMLHPQQQHTMQMLPAQPQQQMQLVPAQLHQPQQMQLVPAQQQFGVAAQQRLQRTSMSSLTCENCGLQGHDVSRCYKLYPHLDRRP